MVNYKNEISKIISEAINGVEILPEYIEIPKVQITEILHFHVLDLQKP